MDSQSLLITWGEGLLGIPTGQNLVELGCARACLDVLRKMALHQTLEPNKFSNKEQFSSILHHHILIYCFKNVRFNWTIMHLYDVPVEPLEAGEHLWCL